LGKYATHTEPSVLTTNPPSPQAIKIAALQAAYRKREASSPRDDAPSAGQIRSLGLLDASKEDKSIKPAALLPSFDDNLPTGAASK
jgi:NADH dehydrogenase (ubiquinone) Fe-S protein 5